MILHCNYEELQALRAGGHSFLEEEGVGSAYASALPESRSRVEALLPRLVGDLSVASLADARDLQDALDTIVEHLLVEMETAVLAAHAADEGAVAAYFDYAHALSVSHRLRGVTAEMEALVELLTGEPADDEAALTFRFPE